MVSKDHRRREGIRPHIIIADPDPGLQLDTKLDRGSIHAYVGVCLWIQATKYLTMATVTSATILPPTETQTILHIGGCLPNGPPIDGIRRRGDHLLRLGVQEAQVVAILRERLLRILRILRKSLNRKSTQSLEVARSIAKCAPSSSIIGSNILCIRRGQNTKRSWRRRTPSLIEKMDRM